MKQSYYANSSAYNAKKAKFVRKKRTQTNDQPNTPQLEKTIKTPPKPEKEQLQEPQENPQPEKEEAIKTPEPEPKPEEEEAIKTPEPEQEEEAIKTPKSEDEAIKTPKQQKDEAIKTPEPEQEEQAIETPEPEQAGVNTKYHYNTLVQFRTENIGLGFCPRKKAVNLFQLIRQTPAPHFVVEIGVHLASSLVVMGATVKGKGSCVGIDPYVPYIQKSLPRVQGQLNNVDQDWVYEKASEAINKNELNSTVRIVRDTSAHYASKIKHNSVSFLHVDGNHDYEDVKNDLRLYSPKVMKDGIILCNATHFPEVANAVDEFLANNKRFQKITSINLINMTAFKKTK